MFDTLTHGELLKKTAMEVEADIAGIHKQIEEISERNEWRVLQSYRKHKVSDTHFMPSTGYGYDDIGRDTLESIYADVFGGEAGLVRPQIISGTADDRRLDAGSGLYRFGVCRYYAGNGHISLSTQRILYAAA